MYYKLQTGHAYDKMLLPFIREIEMPCHRSEFQYLEKQPLLWCIPNEEKFRFQELYYVIDRVPVFARQVWESAESLSDTDGMFLIPLVIRHCGEQHDYTIAVPPRLHCLDQQGRFLPRNVGRYHIFKPYSPEDTTIYITERMMAELSVFSTLIIKGVE